MVLIQDNHTHSTSNYQASKQLILNYFDEMESASPETLGQVVKKYVADDYKWRGVYPFRQIDDVDTVIAQFWQPLWNTLRHIQRRQDIFIAGTNEISGEQWVMSMGNFMGLFDADWLSIRHTRQMAMLRYAEFNCVVDGKIKETGIFVDLIGLMVQAGMNPLPPSTGVYFNYPGPRTHDGLLYDDAPAEQGKKTLALVNEMIDDLNDLNESGSMGCPPEVLERTWSDRMIWYGPAGVGATYTIPRYQEQHQLPFRENLTDKKFHGHVSRFAEGNYACFFGWPNLSNTPVGGWLGLPGGNVNAEMQVVDVYRREGDKLAENWVLIDIPFWLKQQGLDIFERTSRIMNTK
ncbi:MAG: nuclear transport factor 2 family protein [Chloroflexota bacterium]